jgi:hypothetical protein
MIMCFNLKKGVSEEEFVNKVKELSDYYKGKVDGLGTMRLYRHHFFGANRRTYQMHTEVKDFGTWDRFQTFIEKDTKGARLMQENWWKLIDMDTHFDDFVKEIPL